MDLGTLLLDWYAREARDLPWRHPDAGPWPILISEVMLQQTPVHRVLPVWHEWVERWPTPADLAASSAGDAIRAWGRLGYPRRAMRLHACAQALVERHGGVVPQRLDQLLALPGVGDYTARAVLAFAFGQRHPVVDVNVRRVAARAVTGVAEPGPATTPADMAIVEALLPTEIADAAKLSAALMELGAVTCVARNPRCGDCPIAGVCAWRAAGSPVDEQAPRRRTQKYEGTDRYVRGLILAELRAVPDPVPASRVDVLWHLPEQRERALASLLADGLVTRHGVSHYTLPSGFPQR
ncbi:A/G-specific adenine glycosylase [Allocatelliglobosispora scoriae]|uniref:Adenine DNA glycosylase n=1 Tax=Allocatelliglobosispora scoriae TaxID=643052 RepID=A0A841BUA3_9ACTN|nr:A/G-specific adenine glycosylase [Allocatelliglobosispora scoriae]MBB5870739.1 A/G-specific adenine glycosylase [Allocatelliglobosispora scoriae]